MGRFKIGIRWWLAIGFALIAAGTAASIAAVSEHEVREAIGANAHNVAVDKTVLAEFDVEQAAKAHKLVAGVKAAGERRRIALFVFSADGRLLAHSSYRDISWADVPSRKAALTQALAGHRYTESFEHGDANVIAFPALQTPGVAALVAYAPRPRSYPALFAIFRSDVVRVSIWAAIIAALIGFVAATMVALRLRRITETAAAIERGGFDVELRPGFRDEIGSLAGTIDRMRLRLADAFGEIRAERDHLGILLDQLNDGVIAVDDSLTVQFANVRAHAILRDLSVDSGHPLPDTAMGLPLRQVAARLFATDATVAQAEGQAEDGMIVSLVGVPAGPSRLAVLVLTDITERERRQRAEREFVANASHELRTPITAIANAVEALEAGAQHEPESRTTFIRLIGRQSLRLTRLTNSLLILARAQTLEQGVQIVPVELRPLLEEVVNGSEPTDAVEIHVDCAASLVVLAEPDILEQIVSNLLGNALRYTDSGAITLSARRDGDEVVIEVTDVGPGIPIAQQPRIFDRFYSGGGETRSGFGLGLAIVRDSTQAIGGRIEVDSREHEGTIVRLILPTVSLN